LRCRSLFFGCLFLRKVAKDLESVDDPSSVIERLQKELKGSAVIKMMREELERKHTR